MEIITSSAQETQKFGEKIANTLNKETFATYSVRSSNNTNKAVILTLTGELGSGKTTFVQGLAKGLGLPDRILSPTFILMRRYELSGDHFKWFYHIDLYRTQTIADVESLGLPEIFADSRNIVCIEWPERLKELVSMTKIDFTFETIADDTHRIIQTGELPYY